MYDFEKRSPGQWQFTANTADIPTIAAIQFCLCPNQCSCPGHFPDYPLALAQSSWSSKAKLEAEAYLSDFLTLTMDPTQWK